VCVCIVKKLVTFLKIINFYVTQKNCTFVIKTMLGSKARMHFDQSTPMYCRYIFCNKVLK